MPYETILLEKDKGVASITLNIPDRLNAYSPEMGKELTAAWEDVNRDPQVRVMVLTGTGRAFCAGANLNLFREAAEHRRQTGERLPVTSGWFLQNGPLFLSQMDKPTICAINGVAVGLGFTMAVACDLRVMADTATMGAVFPRVGLIPEFGSSFFLPRLVGLATAMDLVLTGRIISSAEAKEIGLVNQVVPAAQLESAARSLAETIAANAPLALKLGKRALYRSMGATLHEQVEWEALAIDYLFGTEDHLEGVKAFLEKRSPHFAGK
ncbi:MAG: enoyl-CoA hydratase/isomerase family protein [Chloroflexi bacterium]|nr:enoyl-CoA hydratase/isomerase family protein [Chloroflexota bacterium]